MGNSSGAKGTAPAWRGLKGAQGKVQNKSDVRGCWRWMEPSFRRTRITKGGVSGPLCCYSLSLERLPPHSLWLPAQPPSGMLGIHFLNCLLSVSPNQKDKPPEGRIWMIFSTALPSVPIQRKHPIYMRQHKC